MSILHYLSSAIGLVLLCSCANHLVDYSISFAHRFKIPKVFIGVVIIGFGSSLPEVFSAATASSKGLSDLAVSTVIGSNIANVGLLLGLSLLITKTWPDMTKSKFDFFCFATSYLILFAIGFTTKIIETWQGIFMLGLLICFVIMALLFKKETKRQTMGLDESNATSKNHSVFEQICGMLTGLIGITIGAKLLIDGAVFIANDWGLSEKIIGITLMALGTSLPETAASIAAAKKDEAQLVVGNVVGSNMFNILGALGVASIASPLPLGNFGLDSLFLLAMALLVSPFFLFKSGKTRVYGIGLLAIYAIYVLTVIV